jgi:hypothetical protein
VYADQRGIELSVLADVEGKKEGARTNAPSAAAARRHRTRWALAAGVASIAILGLLLAFGTSILTAAAAFMIYEDREQPGDNAPDAPSVVAFSESLVPHLPRERLMELQRANDWKHIIVLQEEPRRLQRLGILRAAGEILKDDLLGLGAAQSSIELVPWGDRPLRYSTENLTGWLDEHPGQTIALLCDRLASRACRAKIDNLLTPRDAGRVTVRPLESRGVDETNWWKSRAGMRAYSSYLMGWIHVTFIGNEPVASPSTPPRAHIRQLLSEDS